MTSLVSDRFPCETSLAIPTNKVSRPGCPLSRASSLDCQPWAAAGTARLPLDRVVWERLAGRAAANTCLPFPFDPASAKLRNWSAQNQYAPPDAHPRGSGPLLALRDSRPNEPLAAILVATGQTSQPPSATRRAPFARGWLAPLSGQ